ncbi:hypothetical protein [Spirosoma arcticum]
MIKLTDHRQSVLLRTRYQFTGTSFCQPIPVFDVEALMRRAKTEGHCDMNGPLVN